MHPKFPISALDLAIMLGVLVLLLTLPVLVPLTGTLVRFRAHYNPKGLQLNTEEGVQPHTGPVIPSFFGMLRRVYIIERWAGLFKGLMPSLLSGLVAIFFFLVFFMVNNLRHGKYNIPPADVISLLPYNIVGMFIFLPEAIITNRAITTPYKLPYFNAFYSLRILLTPTERRRPWILYLTPGLLAARAGHIAYGIFLRWIRQQLLPEQSNSGSPGTGEASLVKLVIVLVIALLSTAILTPLEVITIRLSIQRNYAAPEFNTISQEEDDGAVEAMEYAGADEDVINLRMGREPYVGLIDCGKKIIDEEGWSALYRAWWLTALMSLMTFPLPNTH